MAKNAMAKRLTELLKALEEFDPAWKDHEPYLDRHEVTAAFERVGLDPQEPRHHRWLLLFLALVVFGQRAPGRPKKKPTTI
jgi:hypothetical protein